MLNRSGMRFLLEYRQMLAGVLLQAM